MKKIAFYALTGGVLAVLLVLGSVAGLCLLLALGVGLMAVMPAGTTVWMPLGSMLLTGFLLGNAIILFITPLPKED